MSQQEFESLLLTMVSPENISRKHAEETYEQIRAADTLWTMHALVEVCAASQVPSVSTMGLILLRKTFASTVDCYDNAPADVKAAVRLRMIDIFAQSATTKNAKSAAACISALAAKVVKLNEQWNELWENLFATILSPSSTSPHRGACCEVLYHTATALATTYLKGHMQQLATGLNNCLLDPDNAVKKSAFEALQAITAIVDKKKDLPHFRPLVQTMLTSISGALAGADWDGATSLCSALADCAEHNADLFEQHTTPLLQAMMQVASSPQVSKESRHMAVEVMCSYCDSDPKAIRKVAGFSKSLFELLFQYMLNPEIPDDWDNTQDDEEAQDAEGVTDIDIGCTSLDRVATALKAKQLKEIAQKLFMENVHAEHWQQRNAALVLLTYVSEGLQKPFSEQLGSILTFITPLTQDGHKMVRYSAVTCLSQFCNDFAPQIQMEHHAPVLAALRQSLLDPIPRVQTTAAAAINSFFDNAEDGDDDDEAVANRLTPYVHECCGDLVNLFNGSPHLFVKGDCLGALSAIIATCKKGLTPYVDFLVPLFQSVLTSPDTGNTDNDKVLRIMRCKAVECTTLLACGVGKDHFAAYSHPVCQYLNSVLREGLSNDDPRLRYILRGWTCMVEGLKEDVLPYLTEVLPPLLAVANLECDLEVVDNEVGDEDDQQDEDDDVKLIKVCLPGHGETTVRVHTSLIEDKELATTIILSFVDELGAKLGVHLDDITTMACKLLDFSATADIRENGAQILASLAPAYKAVSAEKALEFAHHVIPLLMKAAADENDMSVAQEYLLAVSKAFDAPSVSCAPEIVTNTASLIHQILVASVKRRNELLAKKKAEEDEDELDALEDDDYNEQNLLHECTKAIQSMLRSCTATFVPLFESHFLKTVEELVAPQMDENDVKTGLSMLCDYLEFGKTLTFLPTIASTFIQFSSNEDEAVAQASFYGLGLVADVCHSSLPAGDVTSVQFASQVSHIMLTYLSSPHARKEEYEHTTCNAVSTALKVIDYYGTAGAFDAARLFNTCIGFLPTSGDDVESCRLHELLLRWVVNANPIIGSNSLVVVHALKRAKPDMMNEATRQELTRRFP